MKYTLFLFFSISFFFLIIPSFAPAPLAFILIASGCGLALASSLAYSTMSPIGQVSILPLYVWLDLPGYVSTFGFFLDTASCLVTTLILFITLAVLFFARDYMGHDPAFVRFLSYIALFSCSMVFMVLSIDLVQFFFGWELIGLFSYLLVGFWSSRPSANRSALKAVFLNRAGDFSLFLLITLCVINFGTTSLPALLLIIPFLADSPNLAFLPYLIFVAAVAKSAQYFFQDWLPDAMEGPTPVSSLLHSATMVTAGVFLLIRFSQVFSSFPTFQIFLGSIGAATALFGGLFAFSQFDLKRIVAYSTTANLGLMVLACGLGFEFVALYHLINHALFKAFLFICSGLLIHATGGRQDLRSATAGFNNFPNLFGLFFFGLICSAGFPSTPSFYSKDMLIALFLSNSFPISFILAFYLTVGIGLFSFLYSLRPLFFIFSTPPAAGLMFHRIPSLGFLSLFMLLLAVLIVPDSVEAVFDPTLSGISIGVEWYNLFVFQSDWPLVELSIPAFFLFFLFFILFFGARFFLSFSSPRFFSRAYQISLATPFRLFGIAKSSLPLSFQIFFNLDRVLLESVGPLGVHNLVSKFNPFWFSFDQVFLFLFSTILVALWFDPRVCIWIWFFLLDFAFDETQETKRRSIEDITVDCKSVNGGSNPPAPSFPMRSFTVSKLFLGSRRGGFYVTFPTISDSLNIQTTPSTYSALASGLDANALDQDLIGRTTFSIVNGPSIGPSRQDIVQFLSVNVSSRNQPISTLLSTPFGISSPAYPSSSGAWFFPAQKIFRSPLVSRWLFRPFVTGSLSGLPACSNFVKFSFRLRFPPRPFLGGVRFEFPFLGSLRRAAGRYLSSVFSSDLLPAPTVINPPLSLSRLLPLFQQTSRYRQPASSRFSLATSFYFTAEARFGLIRSPIGFNLLNPISRNQGFLAPLLFPSRTSRPFFSVPRRGFSATPRSLFAQRGFSPSRTLGFPFFNFFRFSLFITFFKFGTLSFGSIYPSVFFQPRLNFYRHSFPGSSPHKTWRLYRNRTSLFVKSGLIQTKFAMVSKTTLGFSKGFSGGKRFFSSFFDKRFIRFPVLFIRGVLNRAAGFIFSCIELFFDQVFHFYRPGSITSSYLFLPISHPPLDNPASIAKVSFSEEVYLHPPQDGWTFASPAEEIFPVSLSDLVRFPGVENYLPGPQVKNVLPRALGELQPIMPLRVTPSYYRHGDFQTSLPGIENEVSWGWDYDLGSPLLLWHSFVPDPRHYTFVLNRIGFTPIRALIKSYSILVHICLLPTANLPSNYRTKWFSVPTSFIWGRGNFLRLHRLQAILSERATAKANFQGYLLTSLSELESNMFLRMRLALGYLGNGFAHKAKGLSDLFKTQVSLAQGQFAYPVSSVESGKLSKLGFLSQSYQRGQDFQKRIWRRRLNRKFLGSIRAFEHPSAIDSFSKRGPIVPPSQLRSVKGYNLPFSLWSSSSSNPVLNSPKSTSTLSLRPILPVSEVGFEPFFPSPLLPDFDPVFVPRTELVGSTHVSYPFLGTRFSRLGSSLMFANWTDKPSGPGPRANTLFFSRLADSELDGSFFRPEPTARYGEEVPEQYKARAGFLRSFLWQKNQVAFLQSGWFTYLIHRVKLPPRDYFGRQLQNLPSGNLPALVESDPGLDWHRPRVTSLPKKLPNFNAFSFFPNPVSIPVQNFFPRISFQAIVETLLTYPVEYHWPPRGRASQSWLDFPKPTEELPEKSLTVGKKKKPSVKEAEEEEKPKETLQQILDRFRFEVPNSDKELDQYEKEARLAELALQLPVSRFKDLVALDYPRDVAEHEEQRLLLLKTALRLKPLLRGRFWFWRYFRLYEFIAGRFNPYDIHADYRGTGFSYTILYTVIHGAFSSVLPFSRRLWNTLRYDLSLYLTMYTLFPIEDRPSEFQPTIDYSTGHVEPAVEEEPDPVSSPREFVDFVYRFVTQDMVPRLSDLTVWVRSLQHFFAVQIPGFFILALGYLFDLIPNFLSSAIDKFSLNFPFSFKKLSIPRPFQFQILRPLGNFFGFIFPQPFFSQFASSAVFFRNLKEFFFDLFGLPSFLLIRSLLSLMFLQLADFLLFPKLRFAFVLLIGGLLVSSVGSLLVSILLTIFSIPGSTLLPFIDPGLVGFHYLLAGVNSSFARFVSLESFILDEYFGFLFSATFDFAKFVTRFALPFQFLSPILVSPVFALLVFVSQISFFYFFIFCLLRIMVFLSDLATSTLSKAFQILSLLVRPAPVSFPNLNDFFSDGLALKITAFSPLLAFSGLVNYSKNWSRFLTFTAGLLGHSLALPSFVRHAGSTFIYPRSPFSMNSPLDPSPSAGALLLRLPSPDRASDFFTGVLSVPVQAKPRFSSFMFPYSFSFLVKASWRLSSIYAGEHFPALIKKQWHMRPWIYWLKNRTRRRPQGIWLVPILGSTPIRHRPASYITWQYLAHAGYTWAGISKQFPFKSLSPLHLRWTAPTGLDLWVRFLRRIFIPKIYQPALSTVQGLRYLQSVSDSLFRFLGPLRGLTIDLRSFDWVSLALQSTVSSSRFRFDQWLRARFTVSLRKIFSNGNYLSHYTYRLPFDRSNLLSSYFPPFLIPNLLRNPPAPQWDFESPSSVPSFFNTVLETLSSPQARVEKFSSISEEKLLELRFRPWPVDSFFYNPSKKQLYFCRPRIYEFLIRHLLDRRSKLSRLLHRRRRARFATPLRRRSFEELASIFTGVKHGDTPFSDSKSKKKDDESVSYLDLIRRKKGMEPLSQAQARYETEHRFRRKPDETHEDGIPVDKNAFRRVPEPQKKKKPTLELFFLFVSQFNSIPSVFGRFAKNALPFPLVAKFRRRHLSDVFSSSLSDSTQTTVDSYLDQLNRSANSFWLLVQASLETIFWIFRGLISFIILFFLPFLVIPSFFLQSMVLPFFLPFFVSAGIKIRAWVIRSLRLPYVVFSWFYFQLSDWWNMLSNVGIENPEKWDETPYLYQWITNMGYASPIGEETDDIEYQHLAKRDHPLFSAVRRLRLEIQLFWAKFILNLLKWRLNLDRWLFPASYHSYLVRSSSLRQLQYDRFIARYMAALWSSSRIPNSRFIHCRPFYRDLFLAGPELSALTFRIPAFSRPISFAYEFSRFFRLARAYRLVFLFGRVPSEGIEPANLDELSLVAYRLSNAIFSSNLRPFFNSKTRFLPYLARYRQIIRFRDVFKLSLGSSFQQFPRLRPVPYLIERTYEKLHRSAGEAAFVVDTATTKEVVPFGLLFDRPKSRYLLFDWIAFDWFIWARNLWLVILPPIFLLAGLAFFIFSWPAFPPFIQFLLTSIPPQFFKSHTLALIWVTIFLIPFVLVPFLLRVRPFGSSPVQFYVRLDRQTSLFRFSRLSGSAHLADESMYLAYSPNNPPENEEDLPFGPFEFYTFDEELIDIYDSLPNFIYSYSLAPKDPRESLLPPELPHLYQLDLMQRVRGIGRFVEVFFDPNLQKILAYNEYLYALQSLPKWAQWYYLQYAGLPMNPLSAETQESMRTLSNEFVYNIRSLVKSSVLETFPTQEHKSHLVDWVFSPDKFNWRARTLLTSYGTVLRYMNFDPEDEDEGDYDEYAPFSEIRFAGPSWFQLSMAGRLSQYVDDPAFKTVYKIGKDAPDEEFAHMIDSTTDPNLQYYSPVNHQEDDVTPSGGIYEASANVLDEERNADMLTDIGLVLGVIYYHFLVPRFTFAITGQNPLSHQTVSRFYDSSDLTSPSFINTTYSASPRPPATVRWSDSYLQNPNFDPEFDKYHISPRLRRHDHSIVPYLPPHADWIEPIMHAPWFLYPWPDQRPRPGRPGRRHSSLIAAQPRIKTTHAFSLLDSKLAGRRPVLLKGLQPSYSYSYMVVGNKSDFPRRPKLGDLNRYKVDLHDSDSLFYFDTTFRPFREDLSDSEFEVYQGSITSFAETPNQVPTGAGPYLFKANTTPFVSTRRSKEVSGHRFSPTDPRTSWPRELQTEFRGSDPLLNWGVRDLELEFDYSDASSYPGLDFFNSPVPLPDFPIDPETNQEEVPASYFPYFFTEGEDDDWSDNLDTSFEDEDSDPVNNGWYRSWVPDPAFSVRNPSPEEKLQILGHLGDYFQVFDKALRSNRRVDWLRVDEFRLFLKSKFRISEAPYAQLVAPDDFQFDLDSSSSDFSHAPEEILGAYDGDLFRLGNHTEVEYSGFSSDPDSSLITTTNLVEDHVPIGVIGQIKDDYSNPAISPTYVEDEEDVLARGYPNRFWVELEELEDSGFNDIYEPITAPFEYPNEDRYTDSVVQNTMMSDKYESAPYFPFDSYEDTQPELVRLSTFRPLWPVTTQARQLSTPWLMKRHWQTREKKRYLYALTNPYPHPQRDTISIWSLPTPKFPKAQLRRKDRLLDEWKKGRWNGPFGEQFDYFFPEPEFQKLKPKFISHFSRHPDVWSELQIGKMAQRSPRHWMARTLIPGYHYDESGFRDPRRDLSINGPVLDFFTDRGELQRHLELYYLRLLHFCRVSGIVYEHPSTGVHPQSDRLAAMRSFARYTRTSPNEKLRYRGKLFSYPLAVDSRGGVDSIPQHHLAFGRVSQPYKGAGTGDLDIRRIPRWNWEPFTPLEHILNRLHQTFLFGLFFATARIFPALRQFFDLFFSSILDPLLIVSPSFLVPTFLLFLLVIKLFELASLSLFNWLLEFPLWVQFRTSQIFFEEMRPGGTSSVRQVHHRFYRLRYHERDMKIKYQKYPDDFKF